MALNDRFLCVGRVVVAVLVVMMPFVSAPLAAAAEEMISGKVGCINNERPVGVWVKAIDSRSGFAGTNRLLELEGLSKVDFKYKLSNGGKYQVHVGCGGTPKHWKSTIRSDYVSGPHVFLCNDASPISIDAWKLTSNRVTEVFGRHADLTQGIPYENCNTIS